MSPSEVTVRRQNVNFPLINTKDPGLDTIDILASTYIARTGTVPPTVAERVVSCRA